MTKTYRKFLAYRDKLDEQGDFIWDGSVHCCRTTEQQEKFDALWHEVCVEHCKNAEYE